MVIIILEHCNCRLAPQEDYLDQNNQTKKVLFFTSFFHTGWQFFGLHPEKLAKVDMKEINISQDEWEKGGKF